ncbi:MAG: pyruvate kinase [Deltaproteobacteria bacterium]|nr:pyruvate kinase [Deltaproteobacteria bacterium]
MSASLNSRKTKIVATLGPATSSLTAIEELIKAGVNVVRLNFSHGTREEHGRLISSVREVSKRLELPVGILLDLQGPRIRTGLIKGGGMELKPGQTIAITAKETGGPAVITTTYADLYRDVAPGDRILMDDGLIEARVLKVTGEDIECEVVYGGFLKEHKGMNLPGVNVSAPSLSEKDREDLDFGIDNGADFIALSFVRKAADIFELKERLKKKDAEIPIIAKIEKAEAIENLDSILEEADGIMIARGDLGVELSAEVIPVLQKKLISRANEAGKVVITATQMLESMIHNPRPTRAEASDVANAVFDGTDALMLSGETAVGKYAVKAVEMMVKIAGEAEEAAMAQKHFLRRKKAAAGSFAQAVAFAAHAAGAEVGAKAIVVFTQTGETARIISKTRPASPIVAFTPLEKTWRRMSITWGLQPFLIKFGGHTDEMICRGEAALLNYGLAGFGDTIVIVSGTKVGMRGATNMMKIDWIGSEECKLYIKKEGGPE